MKKNIICILGGMVIGTVLCLATASLIPVDPRRVWDELMENDL